jgi:nucleoside-diphosphate-sugar epimerase
MKILITGGAGYIGTVLTQMLLERGDSVRCYDGLTHGIDSLLPFFRHPLYEVVRGDIRDAEALKQSLHDVDAICHLAAIVGYPACKSNPELALEVNVNGTRLLNSMRSQDQLFVFANTGSIYGTVEDKVCTEETPLNPLTVYGRTKMEAEKILLDSNNAISYRLATAFGLSPALRLDLLVNDFCYQAVRNHNIIIYEAHVRRTFIDVHDIARAFIHALEHYELMRGEVYNCGDERLNVSKLDIAKLIQRETKFYVHVADIAKDEDQRNYEVSYDKISNTGFRTNCTLEAGIKQMLTAFRYLRVPNPYMRSIE